MAPEHPPPSRTDDRERFRALWAVHYRAVHAFAVRRVGSPEAAHDVVSETFLVAWRRRDTLPPGMERPWLLGIARRVAANDRRGAARFDALVDRLRTLPTDATSSESPLPGDADRTAVAEAFDALSADDREALALVVWDDLSPREAAAVLGIAAPRFSVRLHRAKQRLRNAVVDAPPRPASPTRPAPLPAPNHPDRPAAETR